MTEDPATGEFPAVERRGHGPNLYDEERHPRQRRTDGGWRYWCAWLYTRTLPLVCLVVAFVAIGISLTRVNHAEFKADRAQQTARSQREGRAVAVDFLCGGLSGVEAAGKKALRGELPGQHGQGLPDAAIAEYNATISRRVISQARVNPKGILDKRTGRIDCNALGRASRATHP